MNLKKINQKKVGANDFYFVGKTPPHGCVPVGHRNQVTPERDFIFTFWQWNGNCEELKVDHFPDPLLFHE